MTRYLAHSTVQALAITGTIAQMTATVHYCTTLLASSVPMQILSILQCSTIVYLLQRHSPTADQHPSPSPLVLRCSPPAKHRSWPLTLCRECNPRTSAYMEDINFQVYTQLRRYMITYGTLLKGSTSFESKTVRMVPLSMVTRDTGKMTGSFITTEGERQQRHGIWPSEI